MDETERFLDGKNLPCVLVENKCDLLDQSQVNNMAELRRFANENEFCNCFRTSAKTGHNIHEAMSFLIENVLDRMSKVSLKESTDRKSLNLDPAKHQNNDNLRQPQKSGCC